MDIAKSETVLSWVKRLHEVVFFIFEQTNVENSQTKAVKEAESSFSEESV